MQPLIRIVSGGLLLAGAGIALGQSRLPPPLALPGAHGPPGEVVIEAQPADPAGPPVTERTYLAPVEQPPPRCGMNPLTPDWLWFLRDRCATITPGALPQPIGWYVHTWNGRMVKKAEADAFVIYNHEWYMGGVVPGPYGFYHIDQIARRLDAVPFPVMIQIEGPPELNETRRQTIVSLLAAKGVHDAEQRVVVGFPEAEGLRLNDLPPRSTGGGARGGAGGGQGATGSFGLFGMPGVIGGATGGRGY